MDVTNSANCENCQHGLGAGCCRINLEKECAAGEYEAWVPRSGETDPDGKTVTVREIMRKLDLPRQILDNALKDAGVKRLSGGGRTACTYDRAEVRQALEKYYSKRLDWLRGKCAKECQPWKDRRNDLQKLEG